MKSLLLNLLVAMGLLSNVGFTKEIKPLCLNATFNVNEDLEVIHPEMAVGIFAQKPRYKARIRFSDNEKMQIKLVNLKKKAPELVLYSPSVTEDNEVSADYFSRTSMRLADMRLKFVAKSCDDNNSESFERSLDPNNAEAEGMCFEFYAQNEDQPRFINVASIKIPPQSLVDASLCK